MRGTLICLLISSLALINKKMKIIGPHSLYNLGVKLFNILLKALYIITNYVTHD